MKKKVLIPVLAFGAVFAAPAQSPAPTKIGVIHVQEAILSTKDGQKAAGELQGKFAPKKSELEKKQGEIAGLDDRLQSRGSVGRWLER